MNYILLAAFVIVIAGVVSAQSEGKFKLSAEQKSKFNNWKLKHKKVYKNDTAEGKAANKYVTNAQKAAEHNSNPNATYTQGDTEDSDMSYEEKVSKRMGFRAPENAKETKFPKKLKAAQTQTAPKAVNYTKLMYPIKNQGNCGACWAFSSTPPVEYYLKLNKLKSPLSEQNLIDCADPKMGCEGGDPLYAYAYMIDVGIAEGTKYKYTQAKGKTCRQAEFPPLLQLPDAAYAKLNGTREDLMRDVVAFMSPVTVGIHATDAFTRYRSGIFQDKTCNPANLTHGVAIVGYGTDVKTKLDYWIIRNSWGLSWGQKGYGLIVRGKNVCGIGEIIVLPCAARDV